MFTDCKSTLKNTSKPTFRKLKCNLSTKFGVKWKEIEGQYNKKFSQFKKWQKIKLYVS